MALAIVHSRAVAGIDALPVRIEVHLSRGLPGFGIVGLAETAVKESRHRVKSAILNAQLDFPVSRIIVNLSPADIPKEGGGFDLPIALGILAASGQIPKKALVDYECFGELALDGSLRPVQAALPIAIAASHSGHALILPRENAVDASVVSKVVLLPASTLLQVVAHCRSTTLITPFQKGMRDMTCHTTTDLSDVVGQTQAKRALEIAASGQHHLLFVGPPGSGKTLLASRIPSILPRMTEGEALETAVVHAVSQRGFDAMHWQQRPFRSPHHTASSVALIGGGGKAKPGEVSLAHNGVLFLDELPEFHRHVLEVLREPLESGEVVVARAAQSVRYPARFQLIAAMNPCPCGYYGDPDHHCHCTEEQIARYRYKISGPLLDRIDLQMIVPPVSATILLGEQQQEESSAAVQARVIAARERQLDRAKKPNAVLSSREVGEFCQIDAASKALLESAIKKLKLSTRAVHRILKVSRTIADLDTEDAIHEHHVAEATGYRLD